MKAFLKRFALFLVPVLGFLAAALIFLPTDRQQAYRAMFSGCGEQGRWIYNRIFLNPHKIDVAFIGSSHTMGAVQDSLLNEMFRKNGDDIAVTNLGFCRTGRDLHYTFIKDLLENKKIKLLVLEITEKEEYTSHPDFPFLASNHDLFFPKAYNREFPTILLTTLSYRLDLQKMSLFNTGKVKDTGPQADYSYYGHDHFADTGWINFTKREAIKDYEKNGNKVRSQYSQKWVNAIVDLAKSKNTPMVFLYIPAYGTPVKKPAVFNGVTTWSIPDSILDKPESWYDEQHLNKYAAKEYAPVLVEQIKTELAKHK
jgi:hypothetical protein